MATLQDIEYHVSTNPEPGSPVLQFTTFQYTGRLVEPGDTMEIFEGLLTHFDVNGNKIGDTFAFKANGVRIPLKILPNTFQQLPIPSVPTIPVP